MSKRSHIGRRAGNYVIKSLIGRGGMAKVFLAEHPRIGRQVAVKVLAPHLALQPIMAQRFEREARAAAQLQHPNIIEILDFGTLEDGSPYYAMELLQGRELRQVATDKDGWTAAEVLPYLQQICAALHEAHEHRLVHRDLKPENIFVLDGEPLTVKILDFGIAKLLEDGDAILTTSGTLLGSPVFVAPEQAAGATDAICRQTDIYSLGVILYWMLCGAPPFEAGVSGMLIAQHIKDPPPPLGERNPAVPEGVASLVHRCLEKMPADRPASALEVAAQFAEALGQQVEGPVDTIPDAAERVAGEEEPVDTIPDTARPCPVGGEPELPFDERPTKVALPLIGSPMLARQEMGSELERPTEIDLPLLGEVEALDDDDRPTDVALPLVRDTRPQGPGPDAKQISLLHPNEPDDETAGDAGQTAVLGLLGDTLPEDDGAEPKEARRTEVLGLIGDDTD